MSDQDDNPERRKRTVWLLAGGAASLILPLLGALYLIRGGSGANAPSGRGDVFERRDSGEKKLVPTQAVVPPSALATPTPAASSLPAGGGKLERPVGSSLDFIKPGAELSAKMTETPKAATATAAAPAPAAAPPAATAATTTAAPAAKTPAKKGKKDFAMPKLQPTRGFSSMGGSHTTSSSKTPAAAGGGDGQDLLKNLPPDAANNPQLQQYLKQQGK